MTSEEEFALLVWCNKRTAKEARNEALEEAVKAVMNSGLVMADGSRAELLYTDKVVSAIRALKEEK